MPLLICTFVLIISCAKGAESLNAPPPWRTAEGRSAVSLSLLSKRHGTALAVTFGFRWLWPYSTLLPEPWAATDGPCWRTSREFHPSEDLSELPPSLVAVAGQEYHYQIADEGRTGLLQNPAAMRNSPPQAVLWTDGYRSASYLAVFDAGIPHRWSWRILQRRFSLPLEGLSSTDVSRCRIFCFQRTGELIKTPSLCTGNK